MLEICFPGFNLEPVVVRVPRNISAEALRTIMDESKASGSEPVPGEEKYIRQMLYVATRFAKRIADRKDWEDVRGFLAVDVVVAIRRHLASGREGSVKGVVMQAAANRVRKVRARRLTREKHDGSFIAGMEWHECADRFTSGRSFESDLDESDIARRMPKELRSLFNFLLLLDSPFDLERDGFMCQMETGIPADELPASLERIRELLSGG